MVLLAVVPDPTILLVAFNLPDVVRLDVVLKELSDHFHRAK